MEGNMKNHLVKTGLVLLAFATILSGCGAAPAVNNTIPAKNSSNTNVNAPANSATTTNVAAAATKPFTKTLELHGIKFTVESPNSATGNTVKVTPSGLETNDVQTKAVVGEVLGAEIADLNIDQSPEVYIYTREAGGNKKAGLIAFSANKKKSLSEVSFPTDDPKSKDLVGFNGGDEFAVVESTLVRRFPVYDGTSSDAKKTGKMRQIQYKLKAGEASWQLFVDKVIEF